MKTNMDTPRIVRQWSTKTGKFEWGIIPIKPVGWSSTISSASVRLNNAALRWITIKNHEANQK